MLAANSITFFLYSFGSTETMFFCAFKSNTLYSKRAKKMSMRSIKPI